MTGTHKHITGNPESNNQLLLDLEAKKLQLHWLLQITKAINYNFTTKQLLDVYEHVLHSQLKVEKLALFINDHEWKCLLTYGNDHNFPAAEAEKIIEELNQLHDIEKEKSLWVKNFETVI